MPLEKNQDILFGVASQTVSAYAIEGRPSSITSVAVYENTDGDTGTAEVATTGSASVGTADTVFGGIANGAGQSNPRLMNVDSGTGIAVGGVYLLTSTNQYTEWVEVVEKTGFTSFNAANPLHHVWGNASDTFESTKMTISVLDAWAADTNNLSVYAAAPRYRVRWVYVVDSATRVLDSFFDLTRYAGKHGVTPTDMENLIPGWLDRLPSYHRNNQGIDIIDKAYEMVRADLRTFAVDDSAIRDREVIKWLVEKKAVFMWAQSRLYAGAAALEEVAFSQLEYQSTLDQMIKVTNKTMMSTETSGAASLPTALSITRR